MRSMDIYEQAYISLTLAMQINNKKRKTERFGFNIRW